MSKLTWTEAIENLRVAQGGKGLNNHHVYKPLLLLYLVERAKSGYANGVFYSEVEDALNRAVRLLDGPEGMDAGLPFWHLQNDGIWTVEKTGSIRMRRDGKRPASRKALLEVNPSGFLREDLWEQASNPGKAEKIGQFLLDRFWPVQEHARVRAAIRDSIRTRVGLITDDQSRTEHEPVQEPFIENAIADQGSATADIVFYGAYKHANEDLATAPRQGAEVDPDALDVGWQAHNRTQNMIAKLLQTHSLTPLSPTGVPNFDIGWERRGIFCVCEVKSINSTNEESQLRKGLGQVLRYRHQIGTRQQARGFLVTSDKPLDSSWEEVCSKAGVVLAWPDVLHRLLA